MHHLFRSTLHLWHNISYQYWTSANVVWQAVSWTLQTHDSTFIMCSHYLYDAGDTFPSDVLDLETDRWQNMPILHWQPCDVINWLVSWSGHNQIELIDEEINLAAFTNMTGDQLCRLVPDDFRAIAPSYGHRLYDEVQRILASRSEYSSCLITLK